MFLLMKLVQHRFHQRKLSRFRGRSHRENGHQTEERKNARARARSRSHRTRGALQLAASSQLLHVQHVGVPRRSDLGTEESGNCAYAQTAQGLVATNQAPLRARNVGAEAKAESGFESEAVPHSKNVSLNVV
eukprot:2242280-Pleurochrysis_carterae.AAC.1